MGKQAQNKKLWQEGYGGWWDSAWQQGWKPNQDSGGSILNMRYDQMKTQSVAEKPGEGMESAAGMTTVQLMQKAVNTSRKANGKVKRIQQEMETKTQQWDEFQKALKQAFKTQLSQYEEDQQRLERELLEAKQIAKEAEHRLREVATSMEDQSMDMKEEILSDPWEDLIAENPAEDGRIKEFLQKALQQAHQELNGMRQVVPVHPPGSGCGNTTAGNGSLPMAPQTTPIKRKPQMDASTPLGKNQAPSRRPSTPVAASFNVEGHVARDPYMGTVPGPPNPFIASPGITGLEMHTQTNQGQDPVSATRPARALRRTPEGP